MVLLSFLFNFCVVGGFPCMLKVRTCVDVGTKPALTPNITKVGHFRTFGPCGAIVLNVL